MKYYSSNRVSKMLGVTAQTLRNWDKEGKLKPSYVKENGYRYYSEDVILSYTQERKTKKNLRAIGYTRGMAIEDEALNTKIDSLKEYMTNKYNTDEILYDIGTYEESDNKEMLNIISKINKKEIDVIVLLYKDKVLLHLFEFFEYFAKLNNVKVVIINKDDNDIEADIISNLVSYIKSRSSFLKGRKKLNSRRLARSVYKTILNENN